MLQKQENLNTKRETYYASWHITNRMAKIKCYRYQKVQTRNKRPTTTLAEHSLSETKRWLELKGERTYSGSPKYDDVDDVEVGLLLEDWHLQHWLPMPKWACKKDIKSPHLKFTQHLTCLTPRHHLLPMPHTNCQSACRSPEPAPVNGYFCMSRARRRRRAQNRDGKAFRLLQSAYLCIHCLHGAICAETP